MPINLNTLDEQLSTVDVFKVMNHNRTLHGKLMVTYRIYPDFTVQEDAERDAVMAGTDADAIAETNAAYAEKLLVSWDLEGRDGKPIPIDQQSIRTEVPTNVLNTILFAIGHDRAKVGPTKKR